MSSFLATVTNLFETESSDESMTDYSEERFKGEEGTKEEPSSEISQADLKWSRTTSAPVKEAIVNRVVLNENYRQKLDGETAFLQDEIRRLKDENKGLKEVWMKSREKLRRMKVVLDTKEELHQNKIEQLLDEKESEIERYRNLITEKELETRAAHEEVKTLLSTHAMRMEQLREDKKNKDMNKEELRKAVRRIEKQRGELLRQQSHIVHAHKQQIESLREQLEKQTEQHEQEKRSMDRRTTTLSSHAENLEEDQAKWTHVMAKTEHEYQVTSLENKKLKEENRSMKLDHAALKAESESLQESIEQLEEDLRSTSSQLNQVAKDKLEFESAISIEQDRAKDNLFVLQQKLTVCENQRLSRRIDTDFTRTLRAKHAKLREELFVLRSEYEEEWSKKTELSVLLQQHRTQAATLSAELRHLQGKERDVELSKDFSMRRNNQNMVYARLEFKWGKAGVSVLRVVDNLGQLLARCIFLNHIARIGFVLYLICFHLFLFGYMFVYIHMDLDGVSKSDKLTHAALSPPNL